MSYFQVIIHRKAVKELKSLPKNIQARILEALKEMKSSPFAGDVRKIKGEEAYRRRIGDYRDRIHSRPRGKNHSDTEDLP